SQFPVVLANGPLGTAAPEQKLVRLRLILTREIRQQIDAIQFAFLVRGSSSRGGNRGRHEIQRDNRRIVELARGNSAFPLDEKRDAHASLPEIFLEATQRQ